MLDNDIVKEDDWNMRRGRNVAFQIQERLAYADLNLGASAILRYRDYEFEVSGVATDMDDLEHNPDVRRRFRLSIKTGDIEYRREFTNVPHAANFIKKWERDAAYRQAQLNELITLQNEGVI